MTYYYEILPDGTIGRATNNATVAETLGLTEKTEQEIIYGFDNKRYLKGTEPPAPEPTYAEKREMAYPSVEEQLDMMYWDKVNNTNLWQEKITEIKNKYPKA